MSWHPADLAMRCFHCGGKAVYELRYSGHWLCRRHFTGLFERRVKKTIRQNRLLSKGDRVLVGLSGGKDSMTVLKILHDVIGPTRHSTLAAVSIDEGIRGKSLRRAVDYCRSLGVEYHTVSFREHFGFEIDNVMRKVEDVMACSVCGVLKRRLMNDYAKAVGATKVATGHNLDDEIQSAFMNVVRGDLDRLARLGPEVGVSRHRSFVPRIKILRECPEAEVRAYADLMKLPYSGRRCPYAKSSYRTTARELLNRLEDKHPGSKYQMLRSTDELASLMRERMAGRQPAVCGTCGEPSSGVKCKTCILLERLGSDA